MSEEYEHPLQVTITIPSDEPRQQGIYSTKHPDAKIIYCRVNKFDAELIDMISTDLGIKDGTFVKLCAIKVAHELERLKDAYLKSAKSR